MTSIGDVVADFEPAFFQARKVAAIKQFGFEAAPKRFGVSVIVAVAASVYALPNPIAGKQLLEAGSRVLAALVGVPDEPGREPAHRRASLTKFSGTVSRTPHLGHQLRLLLAVKQFKAEPSCRAATCGLRFSDTKRRASALNIFFVFTSFVR